MDTPTPGPAPARPEVKATEESVLAIRHWSPTLLSFRCTRPAEFRFTPGHYTRLGLGVAGSRVWRPYSLTSAAGDDFLEFIAIRVPGGAFSERLGELKLGDTIGVDKAAYGFLTVNQLAPGKQLWMLASGTGLGPFMSILRDPAVWRDFERLILVHSVRQAAELAWRAEITALPPPAWQGEAKAQLCYLPIVTREPGATALTDRIPLLLADGRLEAAAGCTLGIADSRLMVCGNPELARSLREYLGVRGYATNRRGVPGQMAFEKYW
jgi:ferredoxin--NADP+ reductase